jgi:putative oxidoreductase
MAYAYFTVHAPNGLWPIQNGGEAAALFSWALLLVAFAGPGRFALARVWSRGVAEPVPSSV